MKARFTFIIGVLTVAAALIGGAQGSSIQPKPSYSLPDKPGLSDLRVNTQKVKLVPALQTKRERGGQWFRLGDTGPWMQ
jgi:hypothetical protein